MASGLCRDCKHWMKPPRICGTPPTRPDMGDCRLGFARLYAPDAPWPSVGAHGLHTEDTLAFAETYNNEHDWMAHLVTAPNFGCVQFEAGEHKWLVDDEDGTQHLINDEELRHRSRLLSQRGPSSSKGGAP